MMYRALTPIRSICPCESLMAHASQSFARRLIVRIERHYVLVIREGLRLVSLHGMNVTEVIIGHGEVRIPFLGRLKSRQRLRIFADLSEFHADLRIHVRT